MRKLIIIPILFLFFGATYAQQRTHIPNSIYGLGKINARGFSRNFGMGRAGLALSSPYYLNSQNPASYSSLDSVSFFFDFGLGADFVKYQTAREGSQKGYDINLRNIAIGFRAGKRWSSSIGIHPFSTVGYRIELVEDVVGTPNETYNLLINGNGGLTQFYWDHSYEIIDHLTLGASLNYLFGKIESKEEMKSNIIADNIFVYQNAYYNKFFVDFGIQYYFAYKKDYVITLGGVFGSNHHINIKNDISVSKSSGTVFMEEVTNKGTFNLPLYGGIGVAVNYKNRLTVTADYLYHNWSGTKSEEKDFQFKSNHTVRAGLEYIPGRIADLGYFGNVAFRLGYYYEQSYLEIKRKRIAENGFSAGLGFPMLQNKTTFNVAYNYGMSGTMDNGLIKERNHSFMVSLTLHDWWFIKRKID